MWSVLDKGKLSNGAGEGNVLVNSVANCSVIIQQGCRSALDTVIYFSCNVLPLGFDTEYIKNLVMHAKLYFSEFYVLHLTHAIVCFFIYKIYLRACTDMTNTHFQALLGKFLSLLGFTLFVFAKYEEDIEGNWILVDPHCN